MRCATAWHAIGAVKTRGFPCQLMLWAPEVLRKGPQLLHVMHNGRVVVRKTGSCRRIDSGLATPAGRKTGRVENPTHSLKAPTKSWSAMRLVTGLAVRFDCEE